MTDKTDRECEISIELLGPGHSERFTALCLIVGRGQPSPDHTEQRVRLLLRSAERQSLNMDLLLGAKAYGRLVGACVAIESPGRTGLVFLAPSIDGSMKGSCGAKLLVKLQTLAWERDLVLLQALLETNDTDAVVYRDAGFRFLAELLYLDRSLAQPMSASINPPDLTYLTYSRELEERFIRAMDASYVQSLDCPQLTGLRNTRDVLLGYMHTGIYDPNLWFLALRDDKPVGVLLMSQVPDRACLEIVYTGVVADERGKHLGDALLSLAIDVGRRRGFQELTLAVDSTNVYARCLYERWRFVEVARRRVWIAAHPTRWIAESELSTKFSTS